MTCWCIENSRLSRVLRKQTFMALIPQWASQIWPWQSSCEYLMLLSCQKCFSYFVKDSASKRLRKFLATESNDLSLMPGNHVVERENQILTSTCMLCHTCPQVDTHQCNFKNLRQLLHSYLQNTVTSRADTVFTSAHSEYKSTWKIPTDLEGALETQARYIWDGDMLAPAVTGG